MYAEPRLAEHLDLNSLQSLTDVYEAVFKVRREKVKENKGKNENHL